MQPGLQPLYPTASVPMMAPAPQPMAAPVIAPLPSAPVASPQGNVYYYPPAASPAPFGTPTPAPAY